MGQRFSAVTDDELGALFTRAQSGDQQAMDQAMVAMEPRIRAACRRNEQQLKCDPAIDPDDLLQQGRLSAIRNLKRWVESSVPPGAYVSVRIRTDLRDWVKKAGDLNASPMSLDEMVGEHGEPAGGILLPFSVVDNNHPGDLELERLLARVPQAAIGAGDDFLALRLRPGTLNPLPDDQTLAHLAQMGKTAAELGQMFGVPARAIKTRMVQIRKSGTPVPRLTRKPTTPGPMHYMSWDAKLPIIKDYLDNHPGVSTRQAKADLGVSEDTLKKARTELAQCAGDGRE